MSYLGSPSTPGTIPPLSTHPPVTMLVKPDDLSCLSRIQESNKIKWGEGIANLWHHIESSPPGSAQYQNAYGKLVRLTNIVRNAYNKQATAHPFKVPSESAAGNNYDPQTLNPGLQVRASNASKSSGRSSSSSSSDGAGKRPKLMNMGEMNLSIKEFVHLADVPARFRTCDLCQNDFSVQELRAQEGFAIYPVRLPVCGHVFCYDCSRIWISHSKCPECGIHLGDPSQGLACIDAQIEKCRRHLIASFNARIQNGLIRVPVGYPTLVLQKKEVIAISDDDDDDNDDDDDDDDDDSTVSGRGSELTDDDVNVWTGEKRGERILSDEASTVSGTIDGTTDYGAAKWKGINTIPLEDLEAAEALLNLRYGS